MSHEVGIGDGILTGEDEWRVKSIIRPGVRRHDLVVGMRRMFRMTGRVVGHLDFFVEDFVHRFMCPL